VNLGNCGSLRVGPLTGTWYRAIQPQHQQTALQTHHTRRFPSRFNEGQNLFDILYLAEDQMVALFEVQALLGSPFQTWVPNPYQTWIILNVNVTLQAVADLTQVTEQHVVDMTIQELTGDWRGYQLRLHVLSRIQPAGLPAPTQRLGEALFRVSPPIEGFLTASAKVPTRRNLVVFPDNLSHNSSLQYTDSAGNQIHVIEGVLPPP
jgi:RES domain-containing protein